MSKYSKGYIEYYEKKYGRPPEHKPDRAGEKFILAPDEFALGLKRGKELSRQKESTK